jgi:ferredoxin
LYLKLSWWPVFLFGWLPFSALVLLVAIKGKMDVPDKLWLGGFLASLVLGVFVWFKFEPALGIVVGAVGMALLGLTGRWPAAIMAGLAGITFSVFGPAWKLGPLSGVLLGITLGLTLAVIVVLLDKLARVHLPSTFLKFGYLIILAGVVAFLTRSPWFCKLCPQGTLEAGIPQILWNVRPDIALRSQVFWLYWVKVAILLAVFVAAIGIRRPFCRLICPIGATYSVFNKFSLLHLKVDHKCTTCRLCAKVCPMDIEVHQEANQLECIRCLECKYHCTPESVQVKF